MIHCLASITIDTSTYPCNQVGDHGRWHTALLTDGTVAWPQDVPPPPTLLEWLTAQVPVTGTRQDVLDAVSRWVTLNQ